MNTNGTLILKRSEIEKLMTPRDYIQGMKEAFSMMADGNAFGTGMLHADYGETEFHIKSGGLLLSRPYFAIKANGSCYTNRERLGLPNMMGTILLFAADNAFPLAILDSIDITRNRTGATTAVAASFLARKESTVVTICGCGNQGRIQLKMLKELFPLKTGYAYSRSETSARDFAEEMSHELSLSVQPVSNLKEAALQSDIIVTCSPAKEPFLKTEYVAQGTFIAAMGADSPDKNEIEARLLAESNLVVDLPEQCAAVGELHHALDVGLMVREDIYATLGELASNRKPGRLSDQDIFIFDATGTAIQDAAAAAFCYEKALQRGVGTFVNLNSAV